MRRLLHQGFVQYNPLYFLSALCFLGGVAVVSHAFSSLKIEDEFMSLSAVVQAYELALIAAAAFLYRLPGQRRPAVILALLALFLLFDPTNQIEALSTLRSGAWLWWALLVPVKLAMLTRAVRVRASLGVWAAVATGALVVAASPVVMVGHAENPGGVHAFVVLGGACVGALARASRPRIVSVDRLDDWGRVVLSRATRAFGALATAAYVQHAAVWAFQFDAAPEWAHVAALLLLLAVWIERVPLAIACAAGAVLCSTWAAGAAALVLLARGPRAWTAAVLACYAAIWTIGQSGAELDVAAAVVLLILAWRRREALLAVPVVLARTAMSLAPASPMDWGFAAIVAGFVALAAGVAVNLRSARRTSPSPSPPASPPA